MHKSKMSVKPIGAELKLNPLNASLAAAMRSGLLARSFRKTAPIMVASAAAFGGAVLAPDTSLKVFDRVVQAVVSEAQATTFQSIDLATGNTTTATGIANVNYSAPFNNASLTGQGRLIINGLNATFPSASFLWTETALNITAAPNSATTILIDRDLNTRIATDPDDRGANGTVGLRIFGGDASDSSFQSSAYPEFVTLNVSSAVQGDLYGVLVSPSGDFDSLTLNTLSGSALYGRDGAGAAIDGTFELNVSGLTIDNDGSITGGNDALRIRGIGGTASITNSGTIRGSASVGSVEGYGIRVSDDWFADGVFNGDANVTSVSGDLTIFNENTGTINGVSAGVFAERVLGLTTINNQGRIGAQSDGPVGDFGIRLLDLGTSSGTEVVLINNNGSAARIEGDIAISIDGVFSTTAVVGSGNVEIVNQNGATINGLLGRAIQIEDVVNDLRIYNLGSNSSIVGTHTNTSLGDAIFADNIGGDIYIENSGVIRVANQANFAPSSCYSNAIFLDRVAGEVRITNSGTINGVDDGIDIDNVDSGLVSITNTGTISAVYDDAIQIEDTGRRTTTPASPADVEVRVVNSGTISVGSLSGGIAINIDNVGRSGTLTTATVSIVNTGNITARSASDLAIYVDDLDLSSSNSVELTNANTIIGRVEIRDVGEDSQTGVIDFDNLGTWRFSGVSTFGANSEANIRNFGGGRIELVGSSRINGVSTFDNAGGTIDLTADGGATSSNLIIDFAASGAGFLGQQVGTNAASVLRIDANLSGSQSLSYLVNDSVDIQDTNASGVTQISVVDTAPTTAGVNVQIGETVVRVDDGVNTLAGAFTLSGDPINKGLWQYQIFTTTTVDGEDIGNTVASNRDRVFRLASAPSEYAHELPALQTAAQEAWHQGASSWLDHANNVRLRLEDGNAVNGGAWARLIGADIERKNVNRSRQSFYGDLISHQNNYQQDVYGVMFGADGAISAANGGTWLLGLTGGVTQSKVNFSTSTTEMNYTAGSVGAYASFVRGGGFFNALLKADMGSTDYTMSNGAGLSARESFETSAFGLLLDAGYRFRSGVAFIEPSFSVSSVSSKVKDKEFLATRVDFSNGTSLRSKLTLATGFSAAWGGTRWEPYLSLSAVNEADAENDVSLSSGGAAPVSVKDKQVETYGQLGLGLKVVGTKGSYGFIKVEHDPTATDNDTVQGDAKRESTSVSAGVKLTW